MNLDTATLRIKSSATLLSQLIISSSLSLASFLPAIAICYLILGWSWCIFYKLDHRMVNIHSHTTNQPTNQPFPTHTPSSFLYRVEFATKSATASRFSVCGLLPGVFVSDFAFLQKWFMQTSHSTKNLNAPWAKLAIQSKLCLPRRQMCLHFSSSFLPSPSSSFAKAHTHTTALLAFLLREFLRPFSTDFSLLRT